MTLDKIAKEHRVRITRDECGDRIIAGKRGQVYVDEGKTCLMLLDAPHVQAARLLALGGKVWQGDRSPNSKGRIVQDARVQDIADDKIGVALRIVGVKKIREMSEAQRNVAMRGLEKAKELRRSPGQTQIAGVESIG